MTPRLEPIDTPQRFASRFNVSRETIERLEIYEALLKQWQRRVNLVAPNTLAHVWQRHFADSAQLLAHAPDSSKWLDLGSGAGFPGLVIAICARNREDSHVHIVESNARKCAFCQEVVRETGCSVEIHQTRIESLGAKDRLIGAGIVTARALAPLDNLYKLASPFFGPGTAGLFLKGRRVSQELERAAESWDCEVRLHPSLTDARARIVEVSALRRKGSAD
ncbi:MAG: 16S rRNA (guanine(527)-N(7))-methyltransferase RsmG [Methyloligellaceae bacterium]